MDLEKQDITRLSLSMQQNRVMDMPEGKMPGISATLACKVFEYFEPIEAALDGMIKIMELSDAGIAELAGYRAVLTSYLKQGEATILPPDPDDPLNPQDGD